MAFSVIFVVSKVLCLLTSASSAPEVPTELCMGAKRGGCAQKADTDVERSQ